jgi:hypothetical protein
MNTFNHVEQPDWRLEQRREQLHELLATVPFGEERKQQVASELWYIIFEQTQRINETVPLEITV